MPRVTAELSGRFLSGEVPQRVSRAISALPITTAQQNAFKFAAEVDRNTIWPTHRIRCFFHFQENDFSNGALR